ncbi:hypothetical protein BJX99DRAFT_253480 [Aspergillus californicus]
MLSQVERMLGSSRMDVQIQLREPAVYSNEDEISGHVILTAAAQLDISTVEVKLSGSAVSRLDSRRSTESHQLFKISDQIFPPEKCATSFTSRAVTVPPGEHSFAFSIRFPQASQCYGASSAPFPSRRIASRQTHLLRRLPPSSGTRTTPEEIKYTLEAIVRQTGIISGTHRTIREIHLHRLSTTILPLEGQNSLTGRKRIVCADALSYDVNASLLHGPFLLSGHPIPLAVDITPSNLGASGSNDAICLQDFQSMVYEITEVRVRGRVETHTRPCIVQTMSNLRLPVPGPQDLGDLGTTKMIVDSALWERHDIPSCLTPTFETCNVSRSYRLEIRLGFGFGRSVRIVEFQFPVYIVSLSAPALSESTGSLRASEESAPDYCEKEIYGEAEFV